ncbi:MAG: TetR/AcrR family transcriptional regulator [Desulfomonile tiedjei]|nr:TetR/AcrR family transcriptional regulator [Desulfomonile tiedjei]
MNTSTDPIIPEPSSPCEKLPTRRERRRAETRERLVDCALRLFSERGFTATTIEDITNAADVGKGTFFNYFPSKEHVLASFAQFQMGKIQKFVTQAVHSTQPAERVLYELAVELTKEYDRCPTLLQNILLAFFSGESTRRLMADTFEKGRVSLAELMKDRQHRGEIRDDFTPTELALQYQRALFGTMVIWSLAPTRPLSDCLKEMWSVLWSGMRAQKPSRRDA